jgi:hypothetical protein
MLVQKTVTTNTNFAGRLSVRILRKSEDDSKTTERKTFLPPENLILIFGDRRRGVQNE